MTDTLSPETLNADAAAANNMRLGEWSDADQRAFLQRVVAHAAAWEADLLESGARFRLCKEHAGRIIKMEDELAEARRRIEEMGAEAEEADAEYGDMTRWDMDRLFGHTLGCLHEFQRRAAINDLNHPPGANPDLEGGVHG